ncbi:hypothetical protein [Nonomuraea fuscirosea]|uniref:hypothetical protein n=1 Tax=Nonomuraea fuscirosea TaxID=1291556 RepID=UPI00343EA581
MLDHYRALFERHPWLADSACWTVVQPFDDEMTPDDLLWRMNGGRDPEERTLDHPMETALDEDLTMLYVFEGDGGYGFLECRYGHPPSDELLRTLSEDARVWTTSWQVNGASTICCAGGGKIQAEIWNYVLGDRIDEEGASDILADFRAMLDALDREDFDGRRATALAFIEAATGVGIEIDGLDGEQKTVIVLDHPVN